MADTTPTTTGTGATVDLAYYADGRLVLCHLAEGPESTATYCGLSMQEGGYDGPNHPTNPPVCPDCHKHVLDRECALQDAINKACVGLYEAVMGTPYAPPATPTN